MIQSGSVVIKTYMDAPMMSKYYLALRVDFQHELRC
jgi:hypothetical protein